MTAGGILDLLVPGYQYAGINMVSAEKRRIERWMDDGWREGPLGQWAPHCPAWGLPDSTWETQ